MGKAAVSFFKWQQLGDATEKSKWCGATSAFTSLGFKVEHKNGMCK